MSADAAVTRFFVRYPFLAVGLYALVVTVCAAAIWGAVDEVLDYRAQVASAHDILDQLRGGRPARGRGAGFAEGTRPGSPFLEGRTVTGWKSIIQDIKNAGAEFIDQEVVVDGNLVTSRNPQDIPAFVKKALEKLQSNLSARIK